MEEENQRELAAALFDTGTLTSTDGIEGIGYVGRIRREIVKHQKVLLSPSGSVTLAEEAMAVYSEIPQTKSLMMHSQSELSLTFVRGCSSSDEVPTMACNRVAVQDQNFYPEPVRDRDKNYQQEKSAIVNAYDSTFSVDSEPALALGKYAKNQALPPFYWSRGFQSLIRKQRLLRCFRYISESYCLVDVYGIGITGRVFSEGSNSGRMIIIEAYSHWNSEKHVIPLPFVELRQLLLESGQEELFKPGRKDDLVRRLVDALVMNYSISAEPLPGVAGLTAAAPIPLEIDVALAGNKEEMSEAGPESEIVETEDAVVAVAAVESQAAALLSLSSARSEEATSPASGAPPPSTTPPFKAQTKPYSISITHVGPLPLPLPYPQSISALIRMHSHTSTEDGKIYFKPDPLPANVEPGTIQMYDRLELPKLEQELVLSGEFTRLSATAVRRAKIEAEEAEAARLEAEKRAAWFAIPKRLRGLIGSHCLRVGPRIFVLSAYIMPIRPTIVVVKAHLRDFCYTKKRRLLHMLSLSMLQRVYRIEDKPIMWSKVTKTTTVARAVREIRGVVPEPKDGAISLGFKDSLSGEYDFPPLRGVDLNADSHTSKHRLARLRNSVTDLRSIAGENHIAPFSEHRHLRLLNSILRDREIERRSQRIARQNSLPSSSTSDITPPPLPLPQFDCPCPRRYLGKARRLCGGVIRVLGIDCHYTLRQASHIEVLLSPSVVDNNKDQKKGKEKHARDLAGMGWTSEILAAISFEPTPITLLTVVEGEAELAREADRCKEETARLAEEARKRQQQEAKEKDAKRAQKALAEKTRKELRDVESVFLCQFEEQKTRITSEKDVFDDDADVQDRPTTTVINISVDSPLEKVTEELAVARTVVSAALNAFLSRFNLSLADIIILSPALPRPDSADGKSFDAFFGGSGIVQLEREKSNGKLVSRGGGSALRVTFGSEVLEHDGLPATPGKDYDASQDEIDGATKRGENDKGEGKDEDESGDDEDEDDESEDEEEDSPFQAANRLYYSFANNFEVLVEIYLPHGGKCLSSVLPGCHTLSRTLNKEQLLQRVSNRKQLLRALMIHYRAWHEAASEEAILEMEADWAAVGLEVMRGLHWVERSFPLEKGGKIENPVEPLKPLYVDERLSADSAVENPVAEGNDVDVDDTIVLLLSTPEPAPAEPVPETVSEPAPEAVPTEPAPEGPLIEPVPEAALPAESAPVPEPVVPEPAAPEEATMDEDEAWILQSVAEDARRNAQTPEQRQAEESRKSVMVPEFIDVLKWEELLVEEGICRGELTFDQPGAPPSKKIDTMLPLPMPNLLPFSEAATTEPTAGPKNLPAEVATPSESAEAAAEEEVPTSAAAVTAEAQAETEVQPTTSTVTATATTTVTLGEPQAPEFQLVCTLAWPRAVIMRRTMLLSAPIPPKKSLLVTVEVYKRDLTLGIVVYNSLREVAGSGTHLAPIYLVDFPLSQESNLAHDVRFGNPRHVDVVLHDMIQIELRFRHIPGAFLDAAKTMRPLELTWEIDDTIELEDEGLDDILAVDEEEIARAAREKGELDEQRRKEKRRKSKTPSDGKEEVKT